MLRVTPGDGRRLLEGICRLAEPLPVQLLVGLLQWLAGEPSGGYGV
jgi:hypothetical protein